MAVDIFAISIDLVISVVLSFAIGLASVILYNRLREIQFKRQQQVYQADEAVIEAVVSEYSRRLKEYDRAISDLRVKMDLIEMRGAKSFDDSKVIVSQRPPHVTFVSEPAGVIQHPDSEVEKNGTTDYILKLLIERPRTSREIQQAIGRTREHTSRLMKKLYEANLVARDVNSKPFRYNITDTGRTQLKVPQEVVV